MAVVNAILIGVSRYLRDERIIPIPNVDTNIRELQEILVNTDYVGLTATSIYVCENQPLTDIKILLAEVAEETRNREDTLFVYYSGHGFLSKKNRSLYLTATDTKERFLETTGLKIDEFKDIVGYSKAGKKVVILDCCYSGKVIGTMGAPIDEQLADQLQKFDDDKAMGTFVMTSTDEHSPAYYDDLNPDVPTYFTNELVKAIREGFYSQEEYWPLVDLFEKVKQELAGTKEGALPLKKIIGDGARIKLIKNKLYKNEHVSWQLACKINTIDEYEKFIGRFKSGSYVAMAERAIAALQEDLLWQTIKKSTKIDDFNQYLSTYPAGRYALEAETKKQQLIQELSRRQEDLFWIDTKEFNDLDHYRAYVKMYPLGQYTREAINRINYLEKRYGREGRKKLLDMLSAVLTKQAKNILTLIVTVAGLAGGSYLFLSRNPFGSNAKKEGMRIDTARIHAQARAAVSGSLKNFDNYTILMDSLIRYSLDTVSIRQYKTEAIGVLLNNTQLLFDADPDKACQSVSNAFRIDSVNNDVLFWKRKCK